MIRKSIYKYGFSLTELMVIMLILTIMLAASMPIITKRSKLSSGKGIWNYTSNTNHIFYGVTPESGVAIGVDAFDDINDKTKLLINTANNTQHHIRLKQENTMIGAIRLDSKINTGLGGSSITFPTGTLNTYATAIGAGAPMARSENCTSISSGVSNYPNSIALGYEAAAVGGSDTIASGFSAQANAVNAIAFGYYSKAASNAIAIGNYANASANSISINGNTRSGVNSIAISYYSNAFASNSIAIGYYANTANGFQPNLQSDSIAIGNYTRTGGNNSVALGNYANAYSNDAFAALGQAGMKGITLGMDSGAADNGISVGYQTWATYTNGLAIGNFSRASNNSATAIGPAANSSGQNSTTVGYYTKASAENSAAIGYNTNATAANQIILGDTNAIVLIPGSLKVADTAFVVDGSGYWTSSDKRLKNIGKENPHGIEKIRQINTYNYKFKKDKSKTPRVGIIAQELKNILPNAVFATKNGNLIIRQEDVFYAMVNSIKQLSKLLLNIEDNIKLLIAKIQLIEDRMDAIKKVSKINRKKIDQIRVSNKKLKYRLDKLEKSVISKE